MRYPVNLIPGLPVTPDVGIGITLTPVAPPAPAVAATAGDTGAVAPPALVWVNVVTADPSNTAPLALQAPYADGWGSVAGNQLYLPPAFGMGSGEAIAMALVQSVPAGAVITWTLDSLSQTGGVQSGTAPSFDLYDGSSTFPIAEGYDAGNIYVVHFYECNYFTDFGVAIDDLTITAYADGSPIGSLSLSVVAI